MLRFVQAAHAVTRPGCFPIFPNYLFMNSTASSSPTSEMPPVLIGGTIAIDNVKTPHAEAANLLGGSASYAALAASFYSKPVGLVGIIGHDFPKEHLDMLEARGVSLDGIERSPQPSFTWSGEYHENMNDRTTLDVSVNVLENWQVRIPSHLTQVPVLVLANMSPGNQMEMLEQCGILERSSQAANGATPDSSRFVIADTMDLWINLAPDRLHDVLPHVDLFVLNESEARLFAGTNNLVRAGRALLGKGPRNVVVKLGEFGAMLFSQSGDTFRCSAWPLEEVADPTGAGDTFLGAMAGYLASRKLASYDHGSLRQAMIHGSILASFTCEAFSTRRLEELESSHLQERLDEYRRITNWDM